MSRAALPAVLALALAAGLAAQPAIPPAPQNVPFTRIHGAGDIKNRISIVVVGEGWTQADIDNGSYAKVVKELVEDGLLKKQPYDAYKAMIVVHRFDVASAQQGVSDQVCCPTAGVTRDSANPFAPGPANPATPPSVAPPPGLPPGPPVAPVPPAPGAGAPPSPTPSFRPPIPENADPDKPEYAGYPDGMGLGADQTVAEGGAAAGGTGPGGTPPVTPVPPPTTPATLPPVTPVPPATPPAPPAPTGPVIPAGLICQPSTATANSRIIDTYFGVWRQAFNNNNALTPGNIVWFMNNDCALQRLNNLNPQIPRHVMVVALRTTYGRGAAIYGGTGIMGYTVIPLHEHRLYTIGHECGHCFAGLADEYGGSANAPATEPLQPNVTINQNNLKWSDWVNANTPGITASPHPGGKGASAGIWHPKATCVMNQRYVEFCEVCMEQTLQRVYTQVSLVDDVRPHARVIRAGFGESVTFRVDSVGPKKAKIEGDWFLNGRPIRGGRKTTNSQGPSFEITIDGSKLPAGQHHVRFVAADKTPALLGNGAGSSQAPKAARRANNRNWFVRVRAPQNRMGMSEVGE